MDCPSSHYPYFIKYKKVTFSKKFFPLTFVNFSGPSPYPAKVAAQQRCTWRGWSWSHVACHPCCWWGAISNLCSRSTCRTRETCMKWVCSHVIENVNETSLYSPWKSLICSVRLFHSAVQWAVPSLLRAFTEYIHFVYIIQLLGVVADAVFIFGNGFISLARYFTDSWLFLL